VIPNNRPLHNEHEAIMAEQQQYRSEKDSMGEMKVPADAYYGAQTGRAVRTSPSPTSASPAASSPPWA
jgi:hypothetical protein